MIFSLKSAMQPILTGLQEQFPAGDDNCFTADVHAQCIAVPLPRGMDLAIPAHLDALFGDVAARRFARMLMACDEGSDRPVAGAANRDLISVENHSGRAPQPHPPVMTTTQRGMEWPLKRIAPPGYQRHLPSFNGSKFKTTPSAFHFGDQAKASTKSSVLDLSTLANAEGW
ncbi:MAG: hypothetical protein P4L36_19405 [Holophaga sp.]|nr:hypothetical protein [Holophaga sp.]